MKTSASSLDHAGVKPITPFLSAAPIPPGQGTAPIAYPLLEDGLSAVAPRLQGYAASAAPLCLSRRLVTCAYTKA